MNRLTDDDLEFARRFAAGGMSPGEFNHLAHLRLAYIHLANHGAQRATTTFSDALLAFLDHHDIDPAKFHVTLTRAWLRATWHFMQRLGDTSGSEDFLRRSTALHDPQVMLTHYSRHRLFSDEARAQFIAPDLQPIPADATPPPAPSSPAPARRAG
jgi:hypothetical protein